MFAAIFITIAPVIMILRAGADGAFAGIVHMVTDLSGKSIDIATSGRRDCCRRSSTTRQLISCFLTLPAAMRPR
ncbi:MAG: Probable transmembrane protein [uncultured Caballeronia sp.]|nr:MAG: Probable transmembrane protein [uncultured Caballeronia sp.]